MKTNLRQISLLTGVSIAALGAAPALANPHYPSPAPHDGVADGLYAGTGHYFAGGSPSDTIDICAIAVTPDCFLGEKQTGAGAQFATVASTASGQIEQVATGATGPVDFNVVVNAGDSAEIGAVASASGGGAFASVNTAISQNATGSDAISINLQNDGSLLIDALAVSTASNASANADVTNGIYQNGFSFGDEVLQAVVNDGALTVAATAIASGSFRAYASANLSNAIEQDANAWGGDAVNSVVNAGTMHLGAFASANASNGWGTANAGVVNAIDQFANVETGPGNAVNLVQNDSTLTIHATALVSAASTANANASVTNGILQNAQNTWSGTGNATNSVVNAGSLEIGAYASAAGSNFWSVGAGANISNGINQFAQVTAGTGSAANLVQNDGLLTIHATALAAGTSNANANASVTNGIVQNASNNFSGNASNSVVNGTGALDIGAFASAASNGWSGSANANVANGINQNAFAIDGDASNLVQSGGLLTIHATAVAAGSSSVDANANVTNAILQNANSWGGSASNAVVNGAGTLDIGAVASVNSSNGWGEANANVVRAIDQFASATTGDAANLVQNDGTLSIHATAIGNNPTGWVTASAYVNSAVEQDAYAFGGGNASNSIDNDGSLTISASADANGATWAYAYASNYQAIDQNAGAFGGGNASNSLTNGGSLNITAIANASATAPASASAYNTSAIAQYASATGGGDATNSLTNSGTIAIVASANATDPSYASAYAYVANAISQSANATGGGDATNNLANVGTIDIAGVASANASTGSAYAHATVSSAINQYASATGGGDASSLITNSAGALIAIDADAVANGFDYADAGAYVGTGIYQSANAVGGGAALASLTNAGTIAISANASANAAPLTVITSVGGYSAGSALAHATIGTGISQVASAANVSKSGVTTVGGSVLFSYSGTAVASAALANSGNLDIGADAFASAFNASAYAGITGAGIRQDVFANGGTAATANASFANSGSVDIGAEANALGTTFANATAYISTGISQNASAFVKEGAAIADASLDNSGSITVGVDANAVAMGTDPLGGGAINGNASAYASIGTGIYQSANAIGLGLGTLTTAATTFGGIILAPSTAIAAAALDNSGTIDVAANAAAMGGDAFASAAVSAGVVQSANALAVSLADASAQLNNDGAIAVNAGASATATSDATALAYVGTGIGQFASATGIGSTAFAKSGTANAAVGLTNNGTIDIAADAFASGGSTAVAVANVSQGVVQVAQANGGAGAASAMLTNSGDLNVGADASATGGSAIAVAVVGNGVGQYAYGVTSANASLTNSGNLAITAEADAGGENSTFALAQAVVGVGISQSASAFGTGGVASVSLDNSGSLLISADADGALASDGSAVAIGVVGTGIGQYAYASSQAGVTLDNSGTIDMAGVASATADDDATAIAGVGTMVYQSASAWGTSGVASASVINDGAMTGMADAQAIGGDDVFADAFVGGIYQNAFGGTAGSANVSLVNNGPLTISADADAIGGGDGTALAYAEGGTQFAAAGDGATVSLTNTDVISISADADVVVGNAAQKGADAVASATAYGWVQVANSSRSITKSGTTAFTTAFPGTALASSTMTGVGFTRTFTFTNTPTGPALATYNNSGSLSITADASAVGDDTASAFAIAAGTTQVANGTSAVASMVNDGTMEYSANAMASGDNGATAIAVGVGFHQFANASSSGSQFRTVGTGTVHLGTGGTQLVGVATPTSQQRTVTYWNNAVGPALASITNTGSFSVGANATAIAGGNDGPVTGTTAPAVASAFVDAIHQEARGATATAVLDNSGSIDAHANAQASGAANATANAAVQGVLQVANAVSYSTVLNQHFETVTATTTFGHTFTYQTFVTTGTAMAATPVGPATVLFDNSGSLDVSAVASAVAGGAALASATAVGVNQVVSGTSANATVLNSGDIDVLASAFASGTAATANASALGIQQNLFGTAMNASLNNSGSINVGAVASAVMPAFANATGYQVMGTGGGTLSMAVTNSGDLNVSASAIDPLGTAVANAVGMDISNAPTGTATLLGSPIMGSLTNSGTIDVFAFASGTASTANATGISIMSGVNNMTVTNSGSLFVDAVVANGGSANATGLVVGSNGAVTPVAGDLFIFTNDGGNIVVRESMDGGTTWQRGMAIDVSAAPNNSVINLLGDGSIYGNVDVQDGDAIYVESGVTVLDGIINPECMPPVFDVVAKSACGQGSLTIRNNGNLYLVDGNDNAAMDDGPSYVFVDTFNMGATGTITFELNPTSGGTQPIGTYPQVFADVANLDGTLVADIGLGTLLPANNYFWNNVIDANVRNGTFDACVALGLPGAGLGSLFLNGTGAGGNLCIYDAQANVDLGIERTAFNAVGGLTDNQLAVANAIEAVYAPSLTGPFANLLVQMFNFEDGDAADYANALDMLSGVEYPNYLHAVRNNTFVLNSFVSDQMDCAIHIRGVEECRSPESRGRLWVKGTYNSAELDSNPNYIGYDADSWSAMIGGDVTFSNFRLGAFAGYRDIDVSYPDAFTDNGIKADGFQVGAYGAYDIGNFYVRAIGSYSWLGGKSQRRIELFDISTTATGEPDVNVFSLYGEAGARFDLGGSWLTPFVAIDHTSLDLKGFNEASGAGAGLQIDDQTESQTSGLIGLKWAGNWGGIIPEAKVAYRHDFNGDLGVDMRFVDAPAGSDFRKVESYDDGSLIAGLSLAGSMGSSLVGRIGYQGRFNDEVEDHAIYGALTFLFGAAPPPPPPPVAAPPPPPPAPATQTCPDGTVVLATEMCPAPPPPPPPPPPAPERG